MRRVMASWVASTSKRHAWFKVLLSNGFQVSPRQTASPWSWIHRSMLLPGLMRSATLGAWIQTRVPPSWGSTWMAGRPGASCPVQPRNSKEAWAVRSTLFLGAGDLALLRGAEAR